MTVFKTIWNVDENNANIYLHELESKKYKPSTQSNNVYIKILSCFSCIDLRKINIFTKFEKEILINPLFIRILERLETEIQHDELLQTAIYELGKSSIMIHIKNLRKSIEHDILSYEPSGYESDENKNMEHFHIYDINDIVEENVCPINNNSVESFFYVDENTSQKKLHGPGYIFLKKKSCLDLNSVYGYILAGGILNLNDKYMKDFFTSKGVESFANKQIDDNNLRSNQYNQNKTILDISNNSITSIIDAKFPIKLKILIVSNNPIYKNYNIKMALPELFILTMTNCSLEDFDCEKIPSSVIDLNLSDNPIKSIFNMSRLLNLIRLNILNTQIAEFDFSKIITYGQSHDPTKKLIITCNQNQKFKGSRPDWIELRQNKT
uniref:Uncharacterized protein n=1 Tax=viral metagenome TaxID=1070528 RepID=A0A6C0BC07_9ZZZZ